MTLYYFLPIFATIIIGTTINAFLTIYVIGNPVASIERAFFFTLLKFALLVFLGTYFSFYEYWVLLLLIGYYLLFARIYHVKSPVRGLRFLFLSTTFSMSSRLVLVGPISDFGAGFIY